MKTSFNRTYKYVLAALLLTAVISFAHAQQTSTDTAWKKKLVEKGMPVPAYPDSLTVAQDGSGDYRTIQEAVNAVRDLSQVQVIIHIRPGIYHEKIVIPSWKKRISLIGSDPMTTIITNADYSGKDYPGGHDAFGRSKYSTYTSYTVLVQGDEFRAENLTIENTSGRVGQAVALHVEGDRVTIRNCRLLGNQDTLYAATTHSRQTYDNCYIEGTTDFIFGEASVLFRSCTIRSLTDSYITAAATGAGQAYGFVFIDCRLEAAPGVTQCYLGRPWRPHAQTVFINTVMGDHIRPEGWNNWGNPQNEKTVFYAEYNTTGGNSQLHRRAAWSRQLSAKEARKYKEKTER